MSEQKSRSEISIEPDDSIREGTPEKFRDNIIEEVITAVTVITAAGGMKMLLEIVKLWVEERKGRKLKLKSKDVELELHGGMSKKEKEQSIKLFEKLTSDVQEFKVKKGDIELIIQGGMSDKEMQHRIEMFEQLAKNVKDEEVKIIAP